MYKNIKKTALLFVAASLMLTVACTKENNSTNSGNGGGDFVLSKADVTYKLDIQPSSAEALRRAYNVFIDFYDANGQIQTTSEITADNLNWSKEFTLTKFPACYGARFRMVPKSDLSGVGEDEEFNFNATFNVKGIGTSTSGKTRSVGDDSQDIIQNGVEPHNGRSFSKSCRFEVKADGTYERNMEWE